MRVDEFLPVPWVAPLLGLLRRARIAWQAAGASSSGSSPSTPRETDGRGRNAVLVIDASYSMDESDWKPTRLGAAIDASKAYIRRLAQEEPSAQVAIVTYAARACNYGLVGVGESQIFESVFRSIRTDGYTNITAGLRAALKLLGGQRGPCQIVLLTDGHHNHGRSPRSVAQRLRQIGTLESVGIGGKPSDVDEALLKEISSCNLDGTPCYRWIGDKERLVEHFHHLAGRITRR